MAGIRARLRRVSEDELPDEDIRERLQGVLRGLIQDLDLGGRDLRTKTKIINLVEDQDGIDFLLATNLSEFEPTTLEFQFRNNIVKGWSQVNLVSFRAYAQDFEKREIIGAFYDYNKRIRLNIPSEDVINRDWRLSYREALISVVQMGDKPPIPTNFMDMLKIMTALQLMAQVQNDSMAWLNWVKSFTPLMEQELKLWYNPDDELHPGRWIQYVNQNIENPIQPLTRYDQHRSGWGSANRFGPWWPRQ